MNKVRYVAGRQSWCLVARAMRFLWLLVIQFIDNAYQEQFVRSSPCQRPSDRYTRCLAKRDQSAAILTQIIFSYFAFSSKIHKDGLYHEYVLHWVNFRTNCSNSKIHLILCLEHISLCSESAAWLPDPCLNRDEPTGIAMLRPPSCCVIPYSRQQVLSKIFKKWDQGYNVWPCFSVH